MKDMDLLTHESLDMLLADREGPCVSIYLPTHRRGAETVQNPVRFKNLLREAEERLATLGIRTPDARALLEVPYGRVKDSLFWQHQANGLAVFLAPQTTLFYRLPIDFDERVVIAPHFHLSPLMDLVTGDGRFYILALSQGGVRLFEGTRHTVEEVELAGVPTSIGEVLNRYDFESILSIHTASPAAAGPAAGPEGGLYHGHGTTDQSKIKMRITELFRELDGAIHDTVRDQRIPIVLAGVEYIRALYRQAHASRMNLIEDGIDGNPEGASARELHERAWGLVLPLFQRARQAAISRWHELAGNKDKRAIKNLEPVVQAAYSRRIETLLLPDYARYWGKFDPNSLHVQVHNDPQPGDDDLLNLAAVFTLRGGGTVYLVNEQEMPARQFVVAVGRYAS
jgi:hypothetical protein